ncbi:DUF6249 domain-containing protein [uncultured Bacteroides sp.]|uniref:DUF6249 domain-containing protein n=1 Tax=uncultured Bacteroides sp. TaxID=162156 RepID=UPI002AA7CAD3|nr:DUF6249 domain-containing protein [uncultured Bacteroides sp.]
MKRVIITLTLAVTFCTLILAQKRTILKDSIGKVRITVTKAETAETDKDSDSTFVAGWEDTPDSATSVTSTASIDNDFPFNFGSTDFGSSVMIPIVAIIMIFGFPIFIIFILFFFRYKNRKAKYRLVEQALAAGQPIPEGVFNERIENDIRTRGIKNTFIGIGLFIFLWALTNNFGLGCIGLLIMFTGLGQLVIYYTQNSSAPKNSKETSFNNRKQDHKNNDEEKDNKSSIEE